MPTDNALTDAMTGQCLCGEVRFEWAGPIRAMYHCHCKTCRQANGASFATNLILSARDFRVVTGATALVGYESSPGKKRHFCGRCGSPIYSQSQARPEWVSVRCGTLHSDPGVRPSFHAYVDSRAPWVDLPRDLVCFGSAPD